MSKGPITDTFTATGEGSEISVQTGKVIVSFEAGSGVGVIKIREWVDPTIGWLTIETVDGADYSNTFAYPEPTRVRCDCTTYGSGTIRVRMVAKT